MQIPFQKTSAVKDKRGDEGLFLCWNLSNRKQQGQIGYPKEKKTKKF